MNTPRTVYGRLLFLDQLAAAMADAPLAAASRRTAPSSSCMTAEHQSARWGTARCAAFMSVT